MTPYIELQKLVIEALFRLVEKEPDTCLRQMIKGYRGFRYTGLCDGDYTLLRRHGFREPGDHSADWNADLVKIILEQIDDSGSKVVIRNLLGFKLQGYGQTMTLKEYQRLGENGNHGNWLRTRDSAQPGALKVGDVLITGEKILTEPREGGNGDVLIHLSDGGRGTWLSLPARSAVSLRRVFEGVPDDEVTMI